MGYLERQIRAIGQEATDKIINTKIALFGAGGVGSYVLETLVRNGVGEILVCDFDVVDETNINRQLLANTETIGEVKVELAEKRAKLINPDIKFTAVKEKVSEDNIGEILKGFNPDYIVDAVDDINAKIAIILYAKENGIKCISSMGAGNRLDPTKLKIADIYKTSYCPIAKKVRKILKEKRVKKQVVVYSEEMPKKSTDGVIGSISEVPAAAGITISSWVFNDIIKSIDEDN